MDTATAHTAEAASELSTDELRRYSRHLTLPEFGEDAQKKLKRSSVLAVGAGGLGSPLAMYLAAAGVGRIGLVDFDRVEESNLHRQLLYGTSDVGRPKLEAAEERIADINPHVEVVRHDLRLSSENALEIVGDYDVVADGTDNFPTRYLVNDACVLSGTPNVYASIFRFEGQVSVFADPDGPCYRCLYEEPPPPGLVPSCAEGGVLGVLPGLVGTLQATEVIKRLTGIGDPLVGRLLLVNAAKMEFRELSLRKDPDCPACGDHPTVTELIDYEAFCGIGDQSLNGQNDSTMSEDDSVPEITVGALKELLDADEVPLLLDVREPWEYQVANLDGTLIPLGQLEDRLDEIEKHRDERIVVHCRSGSRSADAVQMLKEAGFADPVNLKGGVLAWADEIDPSMEKY